MRLESSIEEVAATWGPSCFDRLQENLPEEWIEEALNATGVATMRKRRLPAEQVIWLVLGMALNREHPIDFIVKKLEIALPSASGDVARSAIPPARKRVGSKPLEYLFLRSAAIWAHASASRDRWQGLALYGLDGTTMRVPDSDENRSTFGSTKTGRGNGVSGYPMVRLTALMALRSHLLAAARFDGCAVASEFSLAKDLWKEVPAHSLVIVDRGYLGAEVLHEIATGNDDRHWMVRAKKTTKWATVERLGRNDWIVELQVSRAARAKNKDLPETMRVRATRYKHRGSPASVILSSLLDAERFPAAEVVALYHERWEIELGYDEVKTHMLLREEAIRSRSVDGVRQEIWGILLAYNLVRLEMERVAAEVGVPPARISFVGALREIQFDWRMAVYLHSPGTAGKRLRNLRERLGHLVLPPRRSDRRYPRAVKIKMSNYPRKPRAPLPTRSRRSGAPK